MATRNRRCVFRTREPLVGISVFLGAARLALAHSQATFFRRIPGQRAPGRTAPLALNRVTNEATSRTPLAGAGGNHAERSCPAGAECQDRIRGSSGRSYDEVRLLCRVRSSGRRRGSSCWVCTRVILLGPKRVRPRLHQRPRRGVVERAGGSCRDTVPSFRSSGQARARGRMRGAGQSSLGKESRLPQRALSRRAFHTGRVCGRGLPGAAPAA